MDAVWNLLAASVPGTKHLRAGIPCQDAHKFALLENGCLIVAVGDGAGSAKYAEHGSACAVETAVMHLSANLASAMDPDERACLELLQTTVQAVRSRLTTFRLGDESSSVEISRSELATTLLICFATDSMIAACQVGDGGIVELRSSGDVQLLTQPARGEYINETTFVTSDDCEAAASYVVRGCSETSAMVLFTDGIQPLALQLTDSTPFAPFFQNITDYARSPKASSAAVASFLESERVCQRTDDDKTLVIATRSSANLLPRGGR